MSRSSSTVLVDITDPPLPCAQPSAATGTTTAPLRQAQAAVVVTVSGLRSRTGSLTHPPHGAPGRKCRSSATWKQHTCKELQCFQTDITGRHDAVAGHRHAPIGGDRRLQIVPRAPVACIQRDHAHVSILRAHIAVIGHGYNLACGNRPAQVAPST
eukprot:TRINITY_DN143_c0_g1_i1.p1 TRINITY_DN143_c0_g1~~TRINITY_DN143_c0_g1_i1.p1  ORF type:complete len:156 (+),score=13.87 TRINITY_DN143_c0_g1_i1:135-602(+)